MSIPTSTYRLQIRESFDLRAAARVADYLKQLGVGWAYLSPLLKAEDGSDHGYDVVDHSQVDPVRGGAEGLDEFAAAARQNDLGILIDIVPNHMGVAVPKHNAWWWDLLSHGRESKYAEAFDVDWDAGRLTIPVLGDEGSLAIENGELVYFDHRFPIAPGTGEGTPDEVHARQAYELVHWTKADSGLNYRRFFAVNELAAIRVEVPWVFEQSHAEIKRWFDEGLADGLRVDHPDGLLDPGGYLDDLATITGNAYVLVEKILEGEETLPAYWAAAGTTGYDALADVDRVLVDPRGRGALGELDARLGGPAAETNWAALIRSTKRGIADGILNSEVRRLARLVPDSTEETVDALSELLACFPVYRSYLPAGVEHLHTAAERASENRADLDATIDALLPLLSDADQLIAQRFQQTSGMVMAKGVEDTAYYRYSRLASLNEVGADPAEFSIDVAEFHRRQVERHGSFPASQTTLSTHDTKRGEDTRARMHVLSELPAEWEATLDDLRRLAPIGDGPLENILWSSIIGAWPASRERLHNYAEKAAREAGTSTTWTAPNEQFETRMHAAVDAAFDDTEVAGILSRWVDRTAQAGWSNSLSAKLIQLTAPGVPDVSNQGSELWETSLVDPDNRRPVDFDERRLLLAAIDAGAHPPIEETGAAKLLVTSRALRLRRDRPELFTRYAALPAVGESLRHVVAFDRGGAVTVATRLPVALAEAGWGETALLLPGHPVVDVITGREYEGGQLLLADLLSRYPVALLAPL